MISAIKRRYANYSYVLVGADFYSEGGAWRSIHAFYRHFDKAGESLLLLDLKRADGWKQWICALLFSPRIIVNGMAAMERWSVLVGLAWRKDAAVYLHDTESTLDALQQHKPWVYHCLARLLRDRPVLCVSEQMAALYRERFGTMQTTVIYEVTELEPEPKLEPNKIHLVMVGSLNRRKGYSLFLEAAKLASARGLAWQFHWVGGLGEADLLPISKLITWWGWQNSATPILKQADVFFLSSVDDPQPLACLEALALSKRAVVYSGTGSAEIVDGLRGCKVFTKHEAECALEALQSALTEQVDPAAMRSRLKEIADVKMFQRRIDAIFNERNNP